MINDKIVGKIYILRIGNVGFKRESKNQSGQCTHHRAGTWSKVEKKDT